MQGQVYVPVQADESSQMMMSIDGSQGEVNFGGTIHWTLSGGISGRLTFESQGIHVEDNFDQNQVNNAILNRVFQDFSVMNTWRDVGCVTRS